MPDSTDTTHQAKVAKYLKALNALNTKHQLQISAILQFTPTGVVPVLQVTPKPAKK